MCPQFVDFNGDGYPDLVVGTFEGVAFLVPGSKSGFQEPERILDAEGNTILLSAFWNYKTEKWDNADRSPKGQKYPQDHCISVVAVDWSNRGVFDLLLGAKEGGLYLRRNEGTPGKPKFVTTNERVLADGKPLEVPGGLTAPRLVDWNGDGLFDLVCGSFNGGVYLYLNKGKPGQPVFGAPQVLIPPAAENGRAASATEPTRPTEGCYVDVVDYDGDGKLDLLVGGYSSWSPVRKELTDAEKKEAEELQKRIRDVQAAQGKLFQEAQGQAKGDQKELKRLYQELMKTEQYKKTAQELQTATVRMDELRPQPRREAFVWLYRRK
jgi:hypothetical protein